MTAENGKPRRYSIRVGHAPGEEDEFVFLLPRELRDRIWAPELEKRSYNPTVMLRVQYQAVCRAIARWVKRRGHWPTLAQIHTERHKELKPSSDSKLYRALVILAEDLIAQGQLYISHAGIRAVALSDKGWREMTPYSPVEPRLPAHPASRETAKYMRRLFRDAQKLTAALESGKEK